MKSKTFLLFLILAAAAFFAGAYARFTNIDTDPVPRVFNPDVDVDVSGDEGGGDNPAEGDIEIVDIGGRINILLVGEDDVEGSIRSDTMAFVAIDIDNRNVRVLSLPRDTRVQIPGHGTQKLNHAYAYGGVDLLRATVENFIGAPIQYYVKIDYDNFPKLVDIIGGVDILVGKPMKYEDRRGHLKIDIPAGKQHMDGETALKYVRFRKDALGDIGRIMRQQQFLKALLHQMYMPENMLRFPTLAREITNTLKTDMRPSFTLQICSFVKKLDKEQDRIFFMMLPGAPAIIDKLSYWVAASGGVSQFLKANTEELISMDRIARANRGSSLSQVSSAAENMPRDEGAPETANSAARGAPESAAPADDIMGIVTAMQDEIIVLNGTGKSGVGQNVASQLQRMGVDVMRVSNAKHFDYRSSNVIYQEGASESVKKTAQLLGRLCGISGALVRSNKQASAPSLVIGHDYANVLARLEENYKAAHKEDVP
ncbi:transcriptional regulator [Synergistales bacterium]|nr:transcriptional regulator [Synergistales bacterium]